MDCYWDGIIGRVYIFWYFNLVGMLDILTVTYGQYREIACFAYSLGCQTNKAFRTIIMHDGYPKESDGYDWAELGNMSWERRLQELCFDANIVADISHSTIRFNDWGHSLRRIMVDSKIENPFVCLTNADNYYMPCFVEEMLKPFEDEKVGVVYCDIVHSHNHPFNVPQGTYGYFKSRFEPCGCDIGSIVLRADIAKEVGFKHRHRDADASWIQDILDYQKKAEFDIVKVNKVLMVHN